MKCKNCDRENIREDIHLRNSENENKIDLTLNEPVLRTKAKPSRDIGLDITRIIAFISVASVHFFLNTKFYATPVLGGRMYVMVIMRTFFMICVPLFMIMSGYLTVKKKISLDKKGILSHCSKLSKILITYVLATALILIFRNLYLHEGLTIKICLLNLFQYDHYSWYVNMYIGLFLLIPFLNALWNGINKKEGHFILVIIMSILTTAPSIFNIFDFNTPGALIHPWLSTSYNKIVPDWWALLYPITYYFIGAYIKQYVDVKKLSTWKISVILFVSVVCFGLFNIWRSNSVNFAWGEWNGWGSFQNVINSVLVFLLINSIRYRNTGSLINKLVGFIANLTFGAYLLSWIPDQLYYPKLVANIPDQRLLINYFPLAVGKTIALSLILSLGIHFLIKMCNLLLCALTKFRIKQPPYTNPK